MATVQEELKKKKLAETQRTISDTGIVGIPNPIPAIKEGAQSFRQFFANADATAVRGGMRPPVENAPVTPIAETLRNAIPKFDSFKSSQRDKATAGTEGAQTKDMTGTGANTPKSIVPQNTAFQSPVIPTQGVSGETKLAQDSRGQLSISDQAGGTGTIRFNDQRKLGQEQLDSLAQTINKNADPAFQARLAQEAELVNQREQAAKPDALSSELGAWKNALAEGFKSNNLAQVSLANRRIKELEGIGLDREKIGAEKGIAASKLGFEQEKQAVGTQLEAAKQKSAIEQNLFNYFNQSADKNVSPIERFAAAKTFTGGNMSPDIIKASLGELGNQLGELKDDKTAFAELLRKNNVSDEDARSIFNAYSQ